MIGRVLIVEPSVTTRIIVKARLSCAHYSVTCCQTLDSALFALSEMRPDFIVYDAGLGLPNIRVLRAALNEYPDGVRIPIIVRSNPLHTLRFADIIAAGAQDLLSWPSNSAMMRAKIRAILRQTRMLHDLRTRSIMMTGTHHRGQILPAKPIVVVAHTLDLASRWATALKRHLDHHAVLAASYTGVLDPNRYGIDGSVYLIVAEDDAEADDSVYMLSTLKTRANGTATQYVLAADPREASLASDALEMGASDVILPTCKFEDIAARLSYLSAQSTEISELNCAIETGLKLSVFDALTGLHNRRYSDARLDEMLETAVSTETPLALILFDIDFFKRINDINGHLAGDHVLTEVAHLMRECLGEAPLLARIGGEEFLAAIPGMKAQDALDLVHRTREKISELVIALPSADRNVSVTLSAGIALSGNGLTSTEALLAEADKALYDAKAAGRNTARLSGRKIAA